MDEKRIFTVSRFQPRDESQHSSYTDWPYYEKPVGSRWRYKSLTSGQVITPDYTSTPGKKCNWKSYDNADGNSASQINLMNDEGNIYSSTYITGTKWGGESGSRHGSINVWDANGMFLPSSVLNGVSFNLYRERSDDNGKDDIVTKRHCYFLRYFGVELVNRYNDNTRFWSSDICKGPIEEYCDHYYYVGNNSHMKQPDGRYTHEDNNKCWEYQFFNETFPSDFTGPDWLVKGIWFFIGNRWETGMYKATSWVWIYNLKWHVNIQSKERLLLPPVRNYDKKNDIYF